MYEVDITWYTYVSLTFSLSILLQIWQDLHRVSLYVYQPTRESM